MNGTVAAYDWSLAAVYTAILAIFAMLAFFIYRPRSGQDWRGFGVFTVLLAAAFILMFAFPLTIFLLLRFSGSRILHFDSVPHEISRALGMMLDWCVSVAFEGFQIANTTLVVGGFALVAVVWYALHRAHQSRN